MKKEAKTFTLLILSLFGLYGCTGPTDKQPVNSSMSVPFQVSSNFKINVLSYKLISTPGEMPLMPPPPRNAKYIAFRLILSNPGKNRAVKPSTLTSTMEKVELYHPRLTKPIPIDTGHLVDSLAKLSPYEIGFSYTPIKPGSSYTLWMVTLIPKDANPPYKLVFTKTNIGPARYMALDIK